MVQLKDARALKGSIKGEANVRRTRSGASICIQATSTSKSSPFFKGEVGDEGNEMSHLGVSR